jgi:type II secretory ATPase GspE/PulE/Tfp pilus assembly ATPase PilB-like protein
MGVETFLLVSTVRVAVGQRLVRRLTDAKETYTLSSNERAEIGKHADLDRILEELKRENIVKQTATWNTIPFYRPKEGAGDEGYKGRIGIHEVLHVSPAIKEIVLAQGTADTIEKQARAEGMLTMLEDGIYKAALGQTSIEEVLRVISE